jgi:hypothetical protein
MTDTKIRMDALCDTGTHGEHLCYIIAQGLHLSDVPEYLALVEEPRFRCTHCGRAARDRVNLCVPEDM